MTSGIDPPPGFKDVSDEFRRVLVEHQVTVVDVAQPVTLIGDPDGYCEAATTRRFDFDDWPAVHEGVCDLRVAHAVYFFCAHRCVIGDWAAGKPGGLLGKHLVEAYPSPKPGKVMARYFIDGRTMDDVIWKDQHYIRGMKDPMNFNPGYPVSNFRVGDRVELTRQAGGRFPRARGRIVKAADEFGGLALVKFDDGWCKEPLLVLPHAYRRLSVVEELAELAE